MTPREIDALVAEKVMGWHSQAINSPALPGYSSDIAAAWEVVEKIKDIGFTPGAFQGQFSIAYDGIRWAAGFYEDDLGWNTFAEDGAAPMAICLAALKSLGVEPVNKT